jgi:hypothetical protein
VTRKVVVEYSEGELVLRQKKQRISLNQNQYFLKQREIIEVLMIHLKPSLFDIFFKRFTKN